MLIVTELTEEIHCIYGCINKEILSGLTTGETKFDLFSLSRHHFTLSCIKIPLKRCRNRRSEGWTSRNLAVSEDFWMPWCSSFSGKTIRVAQLPIKRPNFTILISLAHKIVMNGQNGKFNSWLVNIQVNLTKTPFLILTILFYYEIQHEVCYEIMEFSIGSQYTCQIPPQLDQVLYWNHFLPSFQVRSLHLQTYRHLDTSLQSTVAVCSQQDRFWRQNGCDNHWNGLPDNHWRGRPT